MKTRSWFAHAAMGFGLVLGIEQAVAGRYVPALSWVSAVAAGFAWEYGLQVAIGRLFFPAWDLRPHLREVAPWAIGAGFAAALGACL